MVRIAALVALFLLACLTLRSSAQAASFDCAKAGTATEKAICRDPALSKQDEAVAAAYKAALTLWPAGNWAAYLRTEQRNWLKDRDQICKGGDVPCLKRDYELRLGYLRRQSLKWTGRYVAGNCPKDGVFIDVAPSYPKDGLSIDIYYCPEPAGSMLPAGRRHVPDATGKLDYKSDADCPIALVFTQDTVDPVSGPTTSNCKPWVRMSASSAATQPSSPYPERVTNADFDPSRRHPRWAYRHRPRSCWPAPRPPPASTAARPAPRSRSLSAPIPQLSRQDERPSQGLRRGPEALGRPDRRLCEDEPAWLGRLAVPDDAWHERGRRAPLRGRCEPALTCLRQIHADRIAVLRRVPGFRLSGIYARGQDFMQHQGHAHRARLRLRSWPTPARPRASPTTPGRSEAGAGPDDHVAFPLTGQRGRTPAGWTRCSRPTPWCWPRRVPCSGPSSAAGGRGTKPRDPEAERTLVRS
jgi:uncharacterized protein YecT (DUF1311 family)